KMRGERHTGSMSVQKYHCITSSQETLYTGSSTFTTAEVVNETNHVLLQRYNGSTRCDANNRNISLIIFTHKRHNLLFKCEQTGHLLRKVMYELCYVLLCETALQIVSDLNATKVPSL